MVDEPRRLPPLASMVAMFFGVLSLAAFISAALLAGRSRAVAPV